MSIAAQQLEAAVRQAQSGQTLTKSIEGSIELGCIRPDLLTTAQVHEIAQFAKRRLDADRAKDATRLVGGNMQGASALTGTGRAYIG